MSTISRYFICLLLGTVFELSCAPPELEAGLSRTGGPDANNVFANNIKANVTNGSQLYAMYCEVCHGPEGTGGGVWSGNIQGFDPIHTIVKNGRGAMAAMPSIPDEDVADIQAYLNSFGINTASLTGLQIYANQCASCHGPEGQGTASGPIIQFTYLAYGKWVTRNGREGLGFPGAMTSYPADRVTDAQLDEIIDFLHAQTRPTTGAALYTTFCGNCHGAGTADGPAAESLAGRDGVSEDVREGKDGTNYQNRGDYMPGWSAAELSDAELTAIEQYLSTL